MGDFHKFVLQNIINFTHRHFSAAFLCKRLEKHRRICHNRMKIGFVKGASAQMKLLEERIMEQGQVRPGNVLKVDCFLNHQLDV